MNRDQITGTVFRIERFAIHDGPGIRTTVFLKGCPLRCAWCHSPESQSPDPEFMPLADRCIRCGNCAAACPEHIAAPVAWSKNPVSNRPAPLDSTPREGATGTCRLCGACVQACPTGARVLVGETMSVESVMAAVERDRIFYDESGGGLTLSGGEPLMQAAFVEAVVDACRASGIHVAIDTSGFVDPAALGRLWPDLFLFDVKTIDDTWHRAITGVSNRTILENLARLTGRRNDARAAHGRRLAAARPPTDILVRFPLVPGLTDGFENVRGIGRLVSSLGLTRVDVLPYHRAGLAKYVRLGRPYALADTEPPTPAQVERVVEILSECGLRVKVGG